MTLIRLPQRFTLLKTFIYIFLIFSTATRIFFFIWSFNDVDVAFFHIVNTFLIGFLFDIGTISFFIAPYALYLLILPKKFHGSLFDKMITYFAYTLGLIIFIFSFIAEIGFWVEFKSRFNFIAVDYLIYTNEVVKNIVESYPLPIILVTMFIILFILFYLTSKNNIFRKTFENQNTFKQKLTPAILIVALSIFFGLFISNKNAEQFKNRYNNELAKSGIYSFFSAFRTNELSYTEFYKTINIDQAFAIVKNKLKSSNDRLLFPEKNEIFRTVDNADSLSTPIHPNVIFICIESLSADFMTAMGNKDFITPNLDSLSSKSLFFTNIFATGTRTVRGMEAITLSIPPTPGRSIVKRNNNQNLFTIGEVFRQEGYERNFFYGGDGYFDNMNTFFGGNGFNIIDRGRVFLIDKDIATKHINIGDEDITFENAWGVCDEDIYNKVITEADKAFLDKKPFFDFIMTTSNHRPFTYPEGKIDIPSGTGRNGAVKYTDFAIGQFLKQAKSKPWYDNTVFVIMADHCASVSGRWELDVKNYHIPAFIFNMPNSKSEMIDKLCSQIDVFPTLFSLLKWDYDSNLFGKNVLAMSPADGRVFIGNYRKLGYLKHDQIMILSEQKKSNFYKWNRNDNSLSALPMNEDFLNVTTAFYQVADFLYRNDGLKLNLKRPMIARNKNLKF